MSASSVGDLKSKQSADGVDELGHGGGWRGGACEGSWGLAGLTGGAGGLASSDVVDLEGSETARLEVLTEVLEWCSSAGRREAVQELGNEDVRVVCIGNQSAMSIIREVAYRRLHTLVDSLSDRIDARERVNVLADRL